MEKSKQTIRKLILSRLMLASEAKYSELQKDITNHDLFNYHLRELQKNGYVTKNNNGCYVLTPMGRQQVALMEEDGSSQKPFKVGLFISLIRRKGNSYQMYLFTRLKHPHYGYSGDITGKLKWGDSLQVNLQRELEEELGIQATKFDMLGVFKKTFRDEGGRIMGEGVYFQFVVTEFVGTPANKSPEGEYFWCDLDKILSHKEIFRETLELSLPKIRQYLTRNQAPIEQFVIEQGPEKLKY
jgi:ADP-ribose pyrophosphatase YjhB (NUDIX family)